MAKIELQYQTAVDGAVRDIETIGMKIAETGQKVQTHNAGLGDLKGAYDLFTNGLGKAADAVKSIITPTIEYGKQIRDLGTFAGITAEESSRLIQVTDDLGVDFTTLRTAARNLADEGLQPSPQPASGLSLRYLNSTHPPRD